MSFGRLYLKSLYQKFTEYIEEVTLEERWGDLTVTEKDSICGELKSTVAKMSHLQQPPNDRFIGRAAAYHTRGSCQTTAATARYGITGTSFPSAGPFSSTSELHDCMSNIFKWPAKARNLDLDLADVIDSYQKMFPDDTPIHFIHAHLNPANIMVSRDSPCRIRDVLKAEMNMRWGLWQVEYLTKVLDNPDPDYYEGFHFYVQSFEPI
ncbi:unnamed protein product [Fusarium venenatum]|uniref:Aminoglycoside phosphotransferase domain-containing protein n=1 Tax=Fusarium venenatum TaxID=56646 RepID=A0A2L2TCI5_9HYPO|nr:LOW QUALITY PROTEIN: uncharacterized protein FVRRES_04310 [Fusarium venenatum]CEI67798.1 unnamed protein product [Fusarium venenatum]